MATTTARALLALAAVPLLAGCHARWNPLGSAPPYYFRNQPADAILGKPVEGTLTDEDAGYAFGFKYEIPAPGSLVLVAKPANSGVQTDILVYSDGNVPVATTEQQGDKKLTVQDLQPGPLYVVVKESWKDAQKTRFKLNSIYKPADPDGANGTYKTQAGARELPLGGASVGDTVDYSAMRRTNYWRVSLQGEGDLTVKFSKDESAKLTAEFVPPSGAPEKIDPVVGLAKKDVQPGDYFIKVTADDAGDAGKYQLSAAFKGGDTCKNGGPACSIEGAEDLKVPADSKQADVDFTKSKQFHFYKLTVKEKGRFTVNFKVLAPPRGSKVGCFLMRAPDDDGEKVTGSSFTRPLEPGEYYLRVVAPDQGDFGKYAMSTIFTPDNFIAADVVEKGVSPCMLTVNAGTSQGVRAGVGVTILGAGNAPIDSGVVDQAFPNLSKVRPNGGCSKIPANGAKVQIQAVQ